MLKELLPEIAGSIFVVIISFIITGLCVYVLAQMGTTSNITVLNTFSEQLSSWGKTWYPIILIVMSAGIIVALLVKGFRS